MRHKPSILIGTSGWAYPHWRGNFYPAELPATDLLAYYTQSFGTVEINNSFYHLPHAQAVVRWRDTVPADFIFSVKASRFITHMKKLKEPAATLPPFMQRMPLLGPKLGPILFQLPAHWRLNLDRLRHFLKSLDPGYRYTFECRDPSWFDDRVYALLAEFNAAWCIFDLNRQLAPLQATTDFVYLRLHGPENAYCGSYSSRALAEWAQRFTDWQAQGKAVYCYFDNDQAGYAPQNALQLIRLLGQTR